MKRIDRDSLKTGDIVGISRKVQLGWSSFRYIKIVPMKIKRITPSRAKIVMENGAEYDRYESFYEIDEDALNKTHVAECAEKLNMNLNKIDKFNRDGLLFTKNDETIIAVCDLLSQIVEELKNDNNLS